MKVDEAGQQFEITREEMAKIQRDTAAANMELNSMRTNIVSKSKQIDSLKTVETSQKQAADLIMNDIQVQMQKTRGDRVVSNRGEIDIKSDIDSTKTKIEHISNEANNEKIDDIRALLSDKKATAEVQKRNFDGLKEVQKQLDNMRTCRFRYVRDLRKYPFLKLFY